MTRQNRLLPFSKNKVISSTTDDPLLICWKADYAAKKISHLTNIIVQEGQIALFLMNQQIVAILEKGSYPWHWVFESLIVPENLSIYYFSTKTFSDQRWGTPTPVLIQDPQSGVLSIRAHGAFSYQLDNPKKLWRHIPNDTKQFSTEDIIHPLRSVILEQFSIAMNNQQNLNQLLKDREALTQQIAQKISFVFEKQYGLKLTAFQIQSLSLPDKSF